MVALALATLAKRALASERRRDASGTLFVAGRARVQTAQRRVAHFDLLIYVNQVVMAMAVEVS